MKQQELIKMLKGIKELLGWQTTLVYQALNELDQDTGNKSPNQKKRSYPVDKAKTGNH